MLAEYFLRLSGILLLYEEIYRAVVDIERGGDGIASNILNHSLYAVGFQKTFGQICLVCVGV